MTAAVEDQAYYAHDDEAYVCWDCATPDERDDPVPGNDAMYEQCARCDSYWEPVDA